MKTYVYLITRKDGKQYVGITIDFKKRMTAHSKTKRFEMGIKNVEILKECDEYEEAGELEEYFISKYNTFYDGLNNSIDGKGNHLAPTFTTLGYRYSEESKQKMKKNHWSRTGSYSPVGKKHSEETKKNWSKKRKGKCWGPRKIPRETALKILQEYNDDSISFSEEYIRKFVKKTDKEKVGKISIEDLKTPNGKYLTKIKLYSEYYASRLNVTPNAITGILKNGIAEDAKQI